MGLFARNPGFTRLFSASAITNLGDGTSALAFPWLASLLTRDPMLIALVSAAMRLPWLIFAIPAGVITDRANRKTLILRADLTRAALTCGVIELILSLAELPPPRETLAVLALALLAFGLGLAEVLRDNAAQTLLPSILRADDLEAANGRLWTIENIMGQFIGPPLAGVLIALWLPLPFVLDALSFVLAAALVAGIAVAPRPPRTLRAPRHEIAEAWAWMRAHPVVLRLALMLGGLNACATMGLTVLVLYSQELLGLSAAGHGMLMTAGAAGGVLGGLWGPKWIAKLGAGRALMAVLALFPLPMLVLAVTTSSAWAALALFTEALAGLIWNIVTVSYRQRTIPDGLLGRVNSVYRFFGWGAIPLGALLAGAVVSWAEPGLGREAALRLVYALSAGGLSLVALYGWARLRL